jgi:hypothetical protein
LVPKKLKIKLNDGDKDADGFFKPSAPLHKSKTTSDARNYPVYAYSNEKKESTPQIIAGAAH